LEADNPVNEHLAICEVVHGSPEYWATVDLRDSILRRPLGLQFSAEELDAEKDSHHVVCYRGDRLVGCLVLRPLESGDVRMRQVAVVPELQRQGIGKALITYSEALARQNGYRRMILHARDTAVGLYEKLGYSRLGDQFEEVTIPHWKMEKSLAFSLNQIVPWGRNFDEYVRMFSLTDADLEKKLLGCGDGPASFNAAMRRTGQRVVSVDPLYQFSSAQIRGRVQEACQTIVEQLVANQSAYVWTTITSPQDLGRIRMVAMEEFLRDFEQGKDEGRYLPCELPQLPFADGQFDLALCSHLLFTYSSQLSADFHVQAICEMCRVAQEVRVFPLLDHGGQSSPHIDSVLRVVEEHGYRYSIEPVDYEFQQGGNQMLRISR